LFVVIVLVLFTRFNIFTAQGALRVKMFISGYPIHAIFSPVENISHDYRKQGLISKSDVIYRVVWPPTDNVTSVPLRCWIVYKKGMFYSAKYYGYG
jgi:hypothetical protein